MRKNELALKIANRTEISFNICKKVLDTAIKLMRDELYQNGDITLDGFVTLSTCIRKIGRHHNVTTGEIEDEKYLRVLTCTTSRGFKDRLNGREY